MSTYTMIPNLAEQDIPSDGILSRTVYNDDQVKAVVFAFGAGQELSEHTASMPAIIQILQGTARLTLGTDQIEASAGMWIHMPAQLPHTLQARTPVIMLLLLLKKHGMPGGAPTLAPPA
ncbi:MAG: Cupin 2 conserved barrel domain protein [Deltaproteobacteria bacterium]|nr:Cupin 2 conserved barrel domain protein [Deltaproteobacteria bacterium]